MWFSMVAYASPGTQGCEPAEQITYSCRTEVGDALSFCVRPNGALRLYYSRSAAGDRPAQTEVYPELIEDRRDIWQNEAFRTSDGPAGFTIRLAGALKGASLRGFSVAVAAEGAVIQWTGSPPARPDEPCRPTAGSPETLRAAFAPPPSLCSAAQRTTFSCETAQHKVVSLCTGAEYERPEYRFGQVGAIELRYPPTSHDASAPFQGHTMSAYQASYTHISFDNGGYAYRLVLEYTVDTGFSLHDATLRVHEADADGSAHEPPLAEFQCVHPLTVDHLWRGFPH